MMFEMLMMMMMIRMSLILTDIMIMGCRSEFVSFDLGLDKKGVYHDKADQSGHDNDGKADDDYRQ
eukprot:5363205-Karenia_brevis.AAC.1